MGSHSGVVTSWRRGNFFLYGLSVRSTKVTASCKNQKTLMTKIGALNFLLLSVDIVFTVVKVYQKLITLQATFQWIIIIILISFNKNMLFQCRNLRVEFINQLGKVQMYWYFSRILLDFCPLKNWKAGRISIFHIQFNQQGTSTAIVFHTTLIGWIAWIEFRQIMWVYCHIFINVDHSFCNINCVLTCFAQ